jgi:hypothetical protein
MYYISVIASWGYEQLEMYIPKAIGKACRGFANYIRRNRLLPVGHRYRGYEF